MTVINPNSVAGINSITVQSGESLSVHKSDGTLIRTIVESTGISTFSSLSVGSATTTNNADKSINIGLGASISSHANNTLSLGTGGDERLSIDSSGRLLLGTTTEGEATADDFTIGSVNSTNDAGMTIRTNTSGTGRLFFSDGTSGTAEYQGYLQYDHSKGLLSLGSGGSTRVNITDVGIGTFIEPGTGNGMGGVVASTANAGGNAGFRWMTDSVGRYQVTTIGSAGAESLRVYDMNNSAERIRITGIGSVGVGINAPIAQLQVNSTKNAETGRDDARNYHLCLKNQADDTGESIGLCWSITSNAEKVGAAILHERDGGGSEGSLQFYVSSDGNSVSEAMRINSNQNVQFTPEGSTSNPYFLIDSTGDNIRLSSQKSSGNGGLIISTQDSGSSAERARFTGIGSFGVGTGGINVESMIHIDRNVSTAYDASAVDAQRGGTATLLVTNANTTNNSFAQIAFRNDDVNESYARIAAVKRGTNSSHLVFVTEHGGTPQESMRINSDGFIGVGGGTPASDPRGQFVINSEKDALANANCNDPHHFHFVLKNDNDTNGESIGMCFSASSTVDRVGAAIIHNREGAGSVGDLQFYTCAAEGTTTHVGRFRSNGDFTTKNSDSEDRQTAGFTARKGDSVQCTRSAGTPLEICRTSNTGNLINFFSGTTNVASVTTNGSSITYNTSSDYRLKENVTNISDGITRIKQLAPKRFNWISDETNTLQDGFLAHEVSSIVPEAITGEKDAPIDEEGKGYQQIDHSKLVPLLTGALQEAIAKIETLETKVAALEGG